MNQTYGFNFGSLVLREVGKKIRSCLRNIDLLARVGADEYFVFLVETDLAGAEFVAERVREALVTSVFKDERASTQITASIGVAGVTADQPEHKMSHLLHITFEALRSAKANGANRIEVYSFV